MRIKYENSKIIIIQLKDYWGDTKEYDVLGDYLNQGYKILGQSESSSFGDKTLTYTLEKPTLGKDVQ